MKKAPAQEGLSARFEDLAQDRPTSENRGLA
jgi:hypothetical protein